MVKAKDIMTKEVITVKRSTKIEGLAKLLIMHRISGAPVIDDNNKLAGIVTENDLIDQSRRLHIPTIFRLLDAYFVIGSDKMEKEIKKMAAITVGEIYTEKVISIDEETSLEEIATIMSEKKIHLLPVIRDNTVVGIVGKADLVRLMAYGTTKQK